MTRRTRSGSHPGEPGTGRKHLGRKVVAVYVAAILAVSMAPWLGMRASATEGDASSVAAVSQQTAAVTAAAATADDASVEAAAQADEAATAEDGTSATADAADEQTTAPSDETDAASSDAIMPQATAEGDGQYSIKIDYVDQSGNKLVPSWQGLAEGGQTWTHDSPAIDNYELVDATQSTMSGTATGDEHFLTYTVTYRLVEATYTVIHQKELNSGAYYTADTETLTADAGSLVTATAKTYAGFHCVTTDRTLAVAADGSAAITLRYDLDRPITYTIYFYTQGSAIDPINVPEGGAVTAPADPTRTGYTFAGWDTDGDGVVDALPTTMPGSNVYATAIWTPATVNYTIVYWKQNQTDNSKYDLTETVTATGTTGETTPTAPAKDVTTGTYKWYQLGHEDPATIAADGSSVLNVYYDLIPIALNLYLTMDDNSKVLYSSQTVRMGQSVGIPDPSAVLSAYQSQGGTKAGLELWHYQAGYTASGSFRIHDLVADFNTKTESIDALFTDEALNYYYWLGYDQNLDGSYPDTPSSTSAATNPEASWSALAVAPRGFSLSTHRFSTSRYDGTNYDALTWTSWTENTTNLHRDYYTASANVIEHRFTRDSYQAIYMSGGVQVASVNHLYESPFTTSADCNGATLTDPSGEGRVFAGWYTDQYFTGNPVSDATMSYQGNIYYAKWVPVTCTVNFDSNGGSAVASETVDKGSTATRPEDPTREGYSFAGWYYRGTDGTDEPVYYAFSQPVESDITLYAMWTQLAPSVMVDYTVVHRTDTGTVLATEQESAGTGTVVSVSALAASDPLRQGYAYVDALNKSLVLTADPASNVIVFTYSNDAQYSYTVHYVDRATGATLAPDDTFTSTRNLVDVDALAIAGYTVENTTGWVSASQPEYTFYYNGPGAPSMTLVKTVSTDTAAPGDTVTYTLTATNVGGSAATGYWVKDYIPTNTTLVSCDAAGTSGASIYGKAFVSWFFPTVDAGQSVTMTMRVKVNECQDGTQVDNIALCEITGRTGAPDITGTDPAGGSSNIATFTVARAGHLPKTGDSLPWAGLMALIGAGLAMVLVSRKIRAR